LAYGIDDCGIDGAREHYFWQVFSHLIINGAPSLSIAALNILNLVALFVVAAPCVIEALERYRFGIGVKRRGNLIEINLGPSAL